jgi:hypothetical protein
MGFAGYVAVCKTSAANSFQNIKEKTPYTYEDGHVGQNI